ncbi:MAG: membrane protein [Ignavibacterium sp.]|uniref:diacylglycerol/polyprenol kinase family protein n=1 Tax=Ignavibacterium sp. TaxID=2651167 RepID=UPI0021DDA9B7|nr:dolichol kinase [Ignavibacterium sp.]BDQ02713.1 MAG: membrane protein [Ignavibacterium sp.]GIV45895.1 MAG: membrane protein [Ignavibacterium sp.]
MNPIDNGTIHYRDELVRKLIHLFSLSIPTIYYFIPKSVAIIILASLTAFALVVDVARYFHPEVGKIFYKIFGFLLRKHEVDHEKKNLNGATYVLISALIGVIIFPKVIFVTAFAILIISDTSAALIGRKFGKRPFLRKSFEGTLAFFISASIVILFTPKLTESFAEYMIGFVAAFIGAIVENISYGIADDNLSIPLSVGFIMWALYLIVFPNLDLILPNVPR